MSHLSAAVAAMLEPGIIKELVTPPGKELTATEAAAIQHDRGALAKRIADQIVMTVRSALDDDMIERMCRAHDQEDAAQKGEPSPWRPDLGADQDPEWCSERRAAMKAALQAVGLA